MCRGKYFANSQRKHAGRVPYKLKIVAEFHTLLYLKSKVGINTENTEGVNLQLIVLINMRMRKMLIV